MSRYFDVRSTVLLVVGYGILPEEQVHHWTEIEEGRFQPRRTRGSYRGRELA